MVCIWFLFGEVLLGGEELLNVWFIFFIVVCIVEYFLKFFMLLWLNIDVEFLFMLCKFKVDEDFLRFC